MSLLIPLNCASVSLPVADCKARWKNIRTQYYRVKRQNDKPSASGSSKLRKEWPLFHLLGFLEDKDFKPVLGASSKKARRLLPRPSPSEIPSSVSLVDSSTGTTVVRHVKMEDNRLAARVDPDELYLMSLLPAFKRLSEKSKAVARVNIETILYTAEFGVDTDDDEMIIDKPDITGIK